MAATQGRWRISLRSKRFQPSYCAKVRAGAFPFFFAHVPTFLDKLARKRLLRRLVADPGEGPGGAGPPSPQGLDGRASLLKVRLDPALKAVTCCSKHKPEKSYI